MSLIPPVVGVVGPQDTVEQNELASGYRKGVVEIQSQLFDKAATYSNLIMVAGYAGVFTIWGNIKTQLTPATNLWIALLLGFSLCAFICYQIFKMAGHVLHFLRVRSLLTENLRLEVFFERWNALDRQARDFSLKSTVVALLIFSVISVVPALLALGLLFYNVIISLIQVPIVVLPQL
jgi:hypothetical protein